MKVVIAPDSFKGSLSAIDVCDHIEAGLKRADRMTRTVKIPVSDGGEGFVLTMVTATKGYLVEETVLDPLGREVTASYGILGGEGGTAVIEMAAASGLPLLSREERDPLRASTYGTGQLMASALNQGVRKILIGIGGSATVDGGAGMAMALGARLLDSGGNKIGMGGGALADLDSIDLQAMNPKLQNVSIEVACDVDNPLTGDTGAARVFGPQKGATPEAVEILDMNLAYFAGILKRDTGIDVENEPGAGAAGGLGAGLMAFAHGILKPGIDVVLDNIGFEKQVADADLVITGEGKIDSQTLFGKVPVGVALRAREYSCPCIAIGGMVDDDLEGFHDKNISAYFGTIHKILPEDDVFASSAGWIEDTAEQILRTVLLGRNM